MPIIKGTHPDVVFRLALRGRDAEGVSVSVDPNDYTVSWASTNTDALIVTPDPEDSLQVAVRFGSADPETGAARQGQVVAEVRRVADGSLVAQAETPIFTIVPGDAEVLVAEITLGELVTEPEPEPEPV